MFFYVGVTAAIARTAGEPLVIEEVEVAPPKAWEVRIKIVCASLCHSDVTLWKMSAVSLSPTKYLALRKSKN